MDFRIGLITIFALLAALSFHEFSHALSAYLMGDNTAQKMGRLTLNPIKHLDWFGTVFLPLMLLVSGLPVFGWAKPVPFNPYNLKYKRWGPAMVAAAGPLSNLIGATIGIILLRLVLIQLPPNNLLVIFLFQLVTINIILGVFNLIPIPPLDGSALLKAFLIAPRWKSMLFFLESKGSMLLILLIVIDSMSPVSILGSLFNLARTGFFTLWGFS